MRAVLLWENFENKVLTLPPRLDLEVRKELVEHPTEAGYCESRGIPLGQSKDYRLNNKDGRGFHIREYGEVWKIHWDEVSPGTSLLCHLSSDTPRLFMTYAILGGGIAGGLTVNYTIGKHQILGGSLLGALFGAIIGSALLVDPGGRYARPR